MKTTHIGSLPYKSIKEAINFNLGLSLPALPTLPRLYDNEWMLNQFLCGFMNNDHELPFSCFDEFFKTFKGRVKVQVCGIQTLYTNLPNKNIDNEKFKDWYLLIMSKFIQKIPNEYVLFFDEPDLRNIDESMWSIYKDFCGIEIGIHSCASTHWEQINLENFNHISFDKNLITPESLTYLQNTNKTLYFGVIDTHSANGGESLNIHDFITPTCGLALSDLDIVEKIHLKLGSKKN